MSCGAEGGGGGGALPGGVAERLRAAEEYVSAAPVGRDVYRRLKQVEDRIAELQSISPEYAHFWVRLVNLFYLKYSLNGAYIEKMTILLVEKNYNQLWCYKNIIPILFDRK